MAAGQGEIYRRFAAYDDEVLMRILTADRAKYRREALAVAESVLVQRGVAPPTLLPAPWPPPAPPGAKARTQSPYQFVDLLFDTLLVWLVCWALVKLWSWTMSSPELLWQQAAFYILAGQLVASAAALRRRWRTKVWRD